MTAPTDKICRKCGGDFHPQRQSVHYCDECRSHCGVAGCEKPVRRLGYCASHSCRASRRGVDGVASLQAAFGNPAPKAQSRGRVVLICNHCSQDFSIAYSLSIGRKFCSKKCADASLGTMVLQCQQCGADFKAKKSKNGAFYKAKFCSKPCAHASYRKPLRADTNGYAVTTVNGKDVYLHRAEMEKKLGRKLFSHETVHHRDGDRMNWKIENLELWSSRHGKGQRVEEKIDAARSLLNEYRVPEGLFTANEAIVGFMSTAA